MTPTVTCQARAPLLMWIRLRPALEGRQQSRRRQSVTDPSGEGCSRGLSMPSPRARTTEATVPTKAWKDTAAGVAAGDTLTACGSGSCSVDRCGSDTLLVGGRLWSHETHAWGFAFLIMAG